MTHLVNDLVPQGLFFPEARYDGLTGHFNATGALVTGCLQNVDAYGSEAPTTPTVFECFRKERRLPAEAAWVVASNKSFGLLGGSKLRDWGDPCAANVILPKHFLLQAIRSAVATSEGPGVEDREALAKRMVSSLDEGYEGFGWKVHETGREIGKEVRATLAGFMTTFHPGVVRTLDYTGPYGDGDHADHHNAAYYAYEAQRDYATPHRVQGFRGYPMTQLPANQSGADAARKLAIFLAYSAHDSHACQTAAACRQDRRYWPWMLRTYQVSGPPAPAVETAQDAPTDQIPAAEASLHRSQA